MAKISDELLVEAVKNSSSVFGVLRYLQIKCAGGSHNHYSRRIKRLGLDISHFTGQLWSKGRVDLPKKSADEILVMTDGYRRQHASMLRRALLEKGIPYCCTKCGQGPEWRGNPLTLDVDHIDENWLNNQLDNLRFLCPNYHSQFSRKLIKDPTPVTIPKVMPEDLCKCGEYKLVKYKHCSAICARFYSRKVDWPSVDLKKLLESHNLTQIGEILGVSANAVKKQLIRSGISLPSRSSLHLKSRRKHDLHQAIP